MEKHSKRWLMSRMKTSGSKRRYVGSFRYADERHEWKDADIETLPLGQSVKSSNKFYNGKINYGILVRFLRGRIGNDWDAVYSEIIRRIPTRLLEHKEMVFWFVANEVEVIDGRLWDRKKQKFIWNEKLRQEGQTGKYWSDSVQYEFYVDPTTNLLQHIQQKSYKNKFSA